MNKDMAKNCYECKNRKNCSKCGIVDKNGNIDFN